MDMRISGDAGLGGSRGVLAAAERWRARGHDLSLALVVEAEGSTYRKPGAFLVVRADGRRRGALSGGCLEPAIDALAREALDRDIVRFAEFDTREDDDLVFGSGSGCRGRIRVMAVPVCSRRSDPLYQAILDAGSACEPLRVAVAWQGPHAGSGIVCFAGRWICFGPAGRYVPEDWKCAMPGTHAAGRSAYGVFDVRPPLRVMVFGAGPEALPLLRCARALGWHVVVADTREAALGRLRAKADRTLCARAERACAELDPMRFDAGIAMTHRALDDLEALRAMAVRPIPYVGLLGPRLRREELLARLDPGEAAALGGRLHAPVGMPLGGDGPEAIALSIVAGLQRHAAGRACLS